MPFETPAEKGPQIVTVGDYTVKFLPETPPHVELESFDLTDTSIANNLASLNQSPNEDEQSPSNNVDEPSLTFVIEDSDDEQEDAKEYRCKKCNAVMNDEFDYAIHLFKCFQNSKQCPICDKIFSSKQYTKKHALNQHSIFLA